MKKIELIEYLPTRLSKEELSEEDGIRIWKEYGGQIDITFPSPKTNHEWELVSRGWVGYIPLTREIGLALQPKLALKNLFYMLEYAYRLESFRFLKGLMDCDSLEDFFQQLARILARRVLDRGRKGFYREYINECDRLPYIRGRMDINSLARSPWRVDPSCHYQLHTPDIIENQIILWTLALLSRSAICTEEVLSEVRQAYRSLQSFVSLSPVCAGDCIGRLYNRLNDDYEPLHALCRFFLEQSGPSLNIGDHSSLPFLVNMARLYELFVFEWLKEHLPTQYTIRRQETVTVGPNNALSFDIDVVIYDTATDEPYCILETKYKTPDKPSNDDFSQVLTYAKIKGCSNAILVYPVKLIDNFDIPIGNIRVRTLTFNLEDNLERAGNEFLSLVLKRDSSVKSSKIVQIPLK